MIRRPPRSTLFPYPPLSRSDPPPAGDPATWLDWKTITDVVPTLVFNRLLRFSTRLPPGIDAPGPRLTLRDDELDRKSTRLNSSHANISYAVFCLKKKKKTT